MPNSETLLRRGKILTPLVIILSLISVSIPVASWAVGEKDYGIPEDGFTFVQRAPMTQIISQSGRIESAQRNVLVSQCEWSTRVVEIVEEGTWVEPGDVIAVLDSSEIRERFQDRQVRYINSIAALEQAKEDLKIQRLTNESTIADATLGVELADLELKSYLDAEYPQQLHQLRSAVVLAEEQLSRAEKSYDYILSMFQRGYRSNDDCEQERLKVIRAENDYKLATDKLGTFQEHSHKRKLTELSAKAEEAKRNLERVRIAARSAELNREIRVTSRQRSYEIYKNYQQRLSRSIEACTIRATKSGEVVHARESSSSSEGIEEGSYIRYLQPVALIPEREKLQVEMRVHESSFTLVEKELPAQIQIDAIGEQTYPGSISHISSIPVRGRRPNYHLREYKVTVDLDIDPSVAREIAPGLTADVTVIAEQRDSCLQVPMTSVIEIGNDFHVFVREGNVVMPRPVELGISDDERVEVMTGVSDGDEIVLRPRITCAEQIVRMQDRDSQESEGSFWSALIDQVN